MQGATLLQLVYLVARHISIHAPYAGSDVVD